MAPDSKISVESFARHCNGQMIPINGSLSYFSVIPLEDGDLQRLVYDPAATVPPKAHEIVPKLNLVVVGYLEKPTKGEEEEGPVVVFRRPAANKQMYSAVVEREGGSYLFVAVKDEDVADCHDSFYQELASLIVAHADAAMLDRYASLLREELKAEVRGEIEDRSWRLKEKVLHKSSSSRTSKVFQEYARESMIDTLTLYLHGLCCDIDVEAGPRQLPSGRIRKRLELLRTLLPPPKGVAVFPEELPQSSS
jgi:hypothetical protein